MKNILFLCTGNSARSILAEAVFNDHFAAYGKAYSAGSNPTGTPNPYALQTLQIKGHPQCEYRSKNVDEFMQGSAAKIDIMVTVCDNAKNDCPCWAGGEPKECIHWGLEDPADATGSDEEILAAFDKTYGEVSQRIAEMVKNF